MAMTAEDITASMEDYLEAIYHISREHKVARAKQIASRMEVAMSSVTGALRHLAQHGLVNYDPYEYITLTEDGRKVAAEIVRRHTILKSFLVNVLSVAGPEAEEAACKMEHAITGEVLERLLRFAEFVEVCPRAGTDWIRDFSSYCENGTNAEMCVKCLLNLLEKTRERRKTYDADGSTAKGSESERPDTNERSGRPTEQ